MAISITQSSQVDSVEWLGVIGTTSRRGTPFYEIRATSRLKNVFINQSKSKPAL
jgi:hypothetical protein